MFAKSDIQKLQKQGKKIMKTCGWIKQKRNRDKGSNRSHVGIITDKHINYKDISEI